MAAFNLFLFTACLLSLSVLASTHIYKRIKDPLLGTMDVTFNFPKNNKLVKEDKQHILDIHNALRLKLALGKERNSWAGYGNRKTKMPPASNMQTMEWDDELATYAQNYASKCKHGHSDLKQIKTEYPRFKKLFLAESLSGALTYLEKDMYGEVRDWNFYKFACKPGKQCGHYRNFVAWAFNHVGCGYKVCKQFGITKVQLVCVYAGYVSTAAYEGVKRAPYQHEYIKGKPCSKCSQGWDFCMGGGLCATKEQCASDPSNKCKPLNKRWKCTRNGGKFNVARSSCKCPPGKMGINCAQNCANEVEDHCGMTCSNEISNFYFCQKSCNGCGKSTSRAYDFWFKNKKRGIRNKHGLVVRTHFPDPDAKAIKVDLKKDPNYKTCKNKASFKNCQKLAFRGYCTHIMYGISITRYCPLSCKKCSSVKKTKPAAGGGWGSIPMKMGTSGALDLSGFKTVGGGTPDLSGFKAVGGGTPDLSGFKTAGGGTLDLSGFKTAGGGSVDLSSLGFTGF